MKTQSASLIIMEGDEVLMAHKGSFDACDWTKLRSMLDCCVC